MAIFGIIKSLQESLAIISAVLQRSIMIPVMVVNDLLPDVRNGIIQSELINENGITAPEKGKLVRNKTSLLNPRSHHSPVLNLPELISVSIPSSCLPTTTPSVENIARHPFAQSNNR